MRKTSFAIFALVASILASTASAQIAPFGTMSGGASNGAEVPGCSAITAIASVVSGTFTCNPASVVNGTATTAGRSILTIRDTISGSSATSNFINITGAFPATLSANANGAYVSVAADNDAWIQTGLYSTVTGTGPVSGAALGLWGEAAAASSAYNFGVAGSASGAGTTSVGVIGRAYAGTNRIGGYFALANQNPPATSAGIVVDNATQPVNIAEFRDNGTAVLTVADGGGTTTTGVWNYTTNSSWFSSGVGLFFGLSPNSGVPGLIYRTEFTPDAPAIVPGSVSNSWHMAELADIIAPFDFQNGRCGTSACTNTSLIIHSVDQSTTEYAQISTDTTGAAGFQSNFAEIRVGGTKTAITEGSAQAIVRFGIPTSTNVFGATVYYTVYDINGANYTSRAGQVRVQGGNSGGTATCTINAGQDTEAEDGSQIATSNAATMTYTWTNVVNGSNCDLSLNATSSQGTNTVAITWTAVVTGNSSSITVVGQ